MMVLASQDSTLKKRFDQTDVFLTLTTLFGNGTPFLPSICLKLVDLFSLRSITDIFFSSQRLLILVAANLDPVLAASATETEDEGGREKTRIAVFELHIPGSDYCNDVELDLITHQTVSAEPGTLNWNMITGRFRLRCLGIRIHVNQYRETGADVHRSGQSVGETPFNPTRKRPCGGDWAKVVL